jgi:hypothetical protein
VNAEDETTEQKEATGRAFSLARIQVLSWFHESASSFLFFFSIRTDSLPSTVTIRLLVKQGFHIASSTANGKTTPRMFHGVENRPIFGVYPTSHRFGTLPQSLPVPSVAQGSYSPSWVAQAHACISTSWSVERITSNQNRAVPLINQSCCALVQVYAVIYALRHALALLLSFPGTVIALNTTIFSSTSEPGYEGAFDATFPLLDTYEDFALSMQYWLPWKRPAYLPSSSLVNILDDQPVDFVPSSSRTNYLSAFTPSPLISRIISAASLRCNIKLVPPKPVKLTTARLHRLAMQGLLEPEKLLEFLQAGEYTSQEILDLVEGLVSFVGEVKDFEVFLAGLDEGEKREARRRAALVSGG